MSVHTNRYYYANPENELAERIAMRQSMKTVAEREAAERARRNREYRNRAAHNKVGGNSRRRSRHGGRSRRRRRTRR
jgi:hypothetical protein